MAENETKAGGALTPAQEREAYQQAIRALAEAATPGPWDFNQGEEGFEVGPSDWRAYQAAPFSEDDPHPGFVPNGFDVTNEAQREQLLRDEEFIAKARTAVPLLCDRIDELQARIDEQAREIERLKSRDGLLKNLVEKIRTKGDFGWGRLSIADYMEEILDTAVLGDTDAD